MRNNRLVSLLASLLLLIAFVAAQTVITGPAPTPTQGAPAGGDGGNNGGGQQQNPPPAATTQAPAGGQPVGSGAPPPPAENSETASPTTVAPGGGGGGGGGGGNQGTPSESSYVPWGSTPADVMLKIPNLSVGRIELDVDNLQAEVNLAAEVAGLVSINAGVQLGIRKVNITIADVQAQLHLIIRLGHLVDIVNRTLASLDLNPLLINILNEVGDIVDNVIGAVDGLLGSILQGGTRLNFLIDNLGNIVQEVVGEAGKILSSIVGNFQDNMTYTGQQQNLGGGLIQKTYQYPPLGTLVNIVFNSAGQVVQAVAVKPGQQPSNPPANGGGGGGGGTTQPAPGTTAPAQGARLF